MKKITLLVLLILGSLTAQLRLGMDVKRTRGNKSLSERNEMTGAAYTIGYEQMLLFGLIGVGAEYNIATGEKESAETIGLLAINEAYDDGEIEQIVKVASKVFDMTNNPLFSKIADSYNAAISDDAEMMSKTGLLSTVIASSVHLFHQGDKDTALSALWPFLQDISANKELSEIMLKTFDITDNKDSPKDRLVAFVQALS